MDADSSFDVLVNIRSYSDQELKSLTRELESEEREVSLRRRLLHGKLDIIRAEMVRRLRDKHKAGESIVSEDDIGRLSEILSARPGGDKGQGLPPSGEPPQAR